MYMLAFLLPIMMLGITWLMYGMAPFGDRLSIISDGEYQFFPFFNEFVHKLKNGESLLWSWNLGFGHDYIAHMAYYLVSPFNFIAALFPSEWVMGLYHIFIVIRYGLMSVTMYIYVRYITNNKQQTTNNIVLLIFALLYAFNARFLAVGAYVTIWQDAWIMMPLTLLGVHYIIDEDRYSLYVISLTLSYLFNMYISVYTSIMILFYFIVLVSAKWDFKVFVKKFIIMALATMVAIGMSAIMVVPTLSAFGLTFRAGIDIPEFEFFFGIIEILSRFLAFHTPHGQGGIENYMPLMYAGLINLLLLPKYIFSEKIKNIEKTITLFVFVFLIIATNNTTLTYIFSGFNHTVGVGHRFSYLISFMLLYMGIRGYMEVEEDGINTDDLTMMAISGAIFIIPAYRSGIERVYLYLNAAMLMMYLSIFYCFMKFESKRKILRSIIVVLVIVELGTNMYRHYNMNLSSIEASDFIGRQEVHLELLTHRDMDESFVRTNFTRANGNRRNSNLAALYAQVGEIYSMNIYTSLMDDVVGGMVRGLGNERRGHGRSHIENTPVFRALFAEKYLVDHWSIRNSLRDLDFYNRVHEVDNSHLFENKYALPVGFMVESDIKNISNIDTKISPFVWQNEIFTAMTGIPRPVFLEEKVTVQSDKDASWFEYEMTEDGYLYAHIPVSNRNNIYADGEYLFDVPREDGIYALGKFSKGQIVAVKHERVNASKRAITFAYMDENVFIEGYSRLSVSPLEIDSFTNTSVKGYVEVNRDQVLYTSIPYTGGNWRAYVDGERVADVVLLDAMIGIELSVGYHEIEFRYVNNAFILGSGISGASILIFIASHFVMKNKKKAKVEADNEVLNG